MIINQFQIYLFRNVLSAFEIYKEEEYLNLYIKYSNTFICLSLWVEIEGDIKYGKFCSSNLS